MLDRFKGVIAIIIQIIYFQSIFQTQWRYLYFELNKALFGDTQTHNEDVLPQAESYLHRFGPGLVLYWFGHAPLQRLDDGQGDIAISDSFPKSVMLPTGEYLNYDDNNI